MMRFNAYLVGTREWLEDFRLADCVSGRTKAGGRWTWALIVWTRMYIVPFTIHFSRPPV